MAARQFVKKDEELGNGLGVISSRTKSAGAGGASRKTILARLLLGLVVLGSLVSISMIAHYDQDSGSWRLPEVSFSINDILEWSDEQIGFSTTFYPGNPIDFHGHSKVDDDTIPLDSTDKSIPITADEFKNLMNQAGMTGVGGVAGVAGATNTQILIQETPDPPVNVDSDSVNVSKASITAIKKGLQKQGAETHIRTTREIKRDPEVSAFTGPLLSALLTNPIPSGLAAPTGPNKHKLIIDSAKALLKRVNTAIIWAANQGTQAHKIAKITDH